MKGGAFFDRSLLVIPLSKNDIGFIKAMGALVLGERGAKPRRIWYNRGTKNERGVIP